ncbi:hypothetical protein MOSE0_C03730 [Monosporozyma servazzii]
MRFQIHKSSNKSAHPGSGVCNNHKCSVTMSWMDNLLNFLCHIIIKVKLCFLN